MQPLMAVKMMACHMPTNLQYDCGTAQQQAAQRGKAGRRRHWRGGFFFGGGRGVGELGRRERDVGGGEGGRVQAGGGGGRAWVVSGLGPVSWPVICLLAEWDNAEGAALTTVDCRATSH